MSADSDIIWIQAVPMPLFGWRTDRCHCGEKFRGKDREHAYELHYRRVHHRESEASETSTQQSITRGEACALFAEVNADITSPPENRVPPDRKGSQ
jgi:hypothetical protein